MYAHQGLFGKGTSKKTDDSQALPIHSLAHSCAEHQKGGDTFWGNTNRAKLCVEHVCRYLDEKHNADGWRKALELLTEWMIREQIK